MLTPDDGVVSVGFPNVLEAPSWGIDRAEALARAKDALATVTFSDKGRGFRSAWGRR